MKLTDKRKHIYRIIAWLPTVLIMYLIFLFSCENATQSTETSSGFVEKLIALFYPNFVLKSATEQNEITYLFTVIVRKGAHFTIYAMLGFCVGFAMSFYQMSSCKKHSLTFIICFVYAISDEIHQLFSSGRACRIVDVLIDSSGALVGMFAFYVMYLLICKCFIKDKKC